MNGEWPSGKAVVFGTIIQKFESFFARIIVIRYKDEKGEDSSKVEHNFAKVVVGVRIPFSAKNIPIECFKICFFIYFLL